jgi:uncharacterized protein (TIGR00725 family)
VTRRPVIAVIGNGNAGSDAIRASEELGRAIVERGYRLVTGGLGGVMEAASRGAHAATTYREGDVIGILPGADPTSANAWVDVAVPTNMGHARNVLIVNMADAVVAVGGGAGTLMEMAAAWQLGRIVIGLDIEGWSRNLAGRPIDRQRPGEVILASDAADAIDKLGTLLGR